MPSSTQTEERQTRPVCAAIWKPMLIRPIICIGTCRSTDCWSDEKRLSSRPSGVVSKKESGEAHTAAIDRRCRAERSEQTKSVLRHTLSTAVEPAISPKTSR